MRVAVQTPTEREQDFAGRRERDAPEDRPRVEAHRANEEREEQRRRAAESELRGESVAVEQKDGGDERGRRGEANDEAALQRQMCFAGRRFRLAMTTVSVVVRDAPVASVAVTVTVYVPVA